MAIDLTYAAQSSVLSQGLADVLNSSVLKDVVLACSEGKSLKAHRLILATFSPYFKKALAVCKEKTPTILLPDLKVNVMEVLLDFMYTGNIRLKKDLLGDLEEANKQLRITGLSELLSKHVGSSLPPNKKQRIEVGSFPSVKPSSMFRPWESPVSEPLPQYTLPWMPSMHTTPTLSSSMLFPMAASGDNLSKTMPFPISQTTPSLSSSMPWTLPFPMPNGNPFLSATAPTLSAFLPRYTETSLSETAPLPFTISYPDHYDQFTLSESRKVKSKSKKFKTSTRKNKTDDQGKGSRCLVPGKQRCDICNSDFFNVAGHKTVAHGLLKKPIVCCGDTFTTRTELKRHKKTHKY